jgi:hypothetical protein
MVASALKPWDGRPVNFERMLARCVRRISGIDGSDRLARLLARGVMVTSRPMVTMPSGDGEDKSRETSRGRRPG